MNKPAALIITDHAEDRFKRRSGLPRRTVTKSAAVALDRGISAAEATGELRRYLETKQDGKAIAYCGLVYIYSGPTLITVYPMPVRYRKAAAKAQARKKAREGGG